MSSITSGSLLFLLLSMMYLFGQSHGFGFATRFRQDETLPGSEHKITRTSRGAPYIGLDGSSGNDYSSGDSAFDDIGMPSRRGPLQGCDSPKECRERLLNYFSSVMKLNKAGR